MKIKKFIGKTEEEATEKAKLELGSQCVIMNVRTVKPKGIFWMFKSSNYEVTAAIEEAEQRIEKNQTNTVQKKAERIDLAADEPIPIPIQTVKSVEKESKKIEKSADPNGLEERLESLQTLLEKKLVEREPDNESKKKEDTISDTNVKYIKLIYRTLLENEVNERYANQLLEEIEKVTKSATSIDYILSNVYQKMILKFGEPDVIEISKKKPKIVFFIGPTGVGKTTTIAKIASKFKVECGRKIAFLTADTYRIAAAEQLRTYANILDTTLTIIYSADEMLSAIARVSDCDLVLVDTAGFSHKNDYQRGDIKELIHSIDGKYEKEVYLVLSATTKYRDLVDITDSNKDISDFKIIFTKLDETTSYGNIYNIRMHTGAKLSYTTNGQNVPDDIELFDTQKIVKNLLGGN
ncbi:MAG: flagellar biosynthesis protein FlhF [Lachnospiraceae bacterium]